MSDPRAIEALRTIRARKAEILALGPVEYLTPETQRAFDELTADENELVDAYPDALDALDFADQAENESEVDAPGVADESFVNAAGAALAPKYTRPNPDAGLREASPPPAPVDPLTAFARGIRNPVGASDEVAAVGAGYAAAPSKTDYLAQFFLPPSRRSFSPAVSRSMESMRTTERDDQAAAERQQPIPHGVGRAATSTALTAPLLAMAPATVPARVAMGAVEGGGLGGLTGAASAEPGQRMEGFKSGSKAGLALGAALPGAFATAGKVAPALERFASMERTAAVGPYGAQMARVEAQKGKGYLADIGRTIERRGVDKRGGVMSGAPMSAPAYARRLDEVVPEVGRELDDVLTQASASGVTVSATWMRNRLAQRAKALGAEKTDSARAQAAKLNELASWIDEDIAKMKKANPRAAASYSPREVQQLKEQWTGEVWKSANPQVALGGNTAEAYRAAAGVPREMLDEAIERRVSPELAARYQGLRDEYGHLRTAQDFAHGRELRETGNQALSLPTVIAGSGGLASGAGAGVPLAAMAATAGVKRYGKDVLADFARGGQRVAEAVSRVSPRAQQATLPAAVPNMSASLVSAQPPAAPPMQSIPIADAAARIADEGWDAYGDASDDVMSAIEANDQAALDAALSKVR